MIIDDASTDSTALELERLENDFPELEVIYLKENKGKANVLNYAMSKIESKYFLCLDSDAELAVNALEEFNIFMKTSDVEYSAITGNPKLKEGNFNTTRTIQQLEYRSIIGMIKRAQVYLLDNIMTVSGVCTIYKIEDVLKVGGFNSTVAAEDIQLSWDLERANMRLTYVPNAILYMNSPVSIYGLLKQRK